MSEQHSFKGGTCAAGPVPCVCAGTGWYLIHLDLDPRDRDCSLELERDLDLELEELLEWDLQQHGEILFPVSDLHLSRVTAPESSRHEAATQSPPAPQHHHILNQTLLHSEILHQKHYKVSFRLWLLKQSTTINRDCCYLATRNNFLSVHCIMKSML